MTEEVSSDVCPECMAFLPAGGACVDLFHRLLLLEHEVMADASLLASDLGRLTHFYAVTAYALQHPQAINYTPEALAAARQNLADMVAGKITLQSLLRRLRNHYDGAFRVTRRPGDSVPFWSNVSWPVTIADVLAGGAAGYVDRVAHWAKSVRTVLDSATLEIIKDGQAGQHK